MRTFNLEEEPERMVNIQVFQKRIAHKFSNTEYAELVNVILDQHSEMSIEEFIGFSGALLSFMDAEKQHSFNSLIRNNKGVKK